MGISVLAGCAGGCIYYNQTVEPTPEWRNLGSPPEPITELIDAEFFTIYVRGESGQLYSYYWESPYAHDGWNKVAEIPEYFSFCDEDSFREPELPIPPFGTPVESFYVRFCSNWAGNSSSSLAVYHLLDSGDVAQWYRNDTFPFIAGYFGKYLLNSSVCSLIGFVVGIFFCSAIWRKTIYRFTQ